MLVQIIDGVRGAFGGLGALVSIAMMMGDEEDCDDKL